MTDELTPWQNFHALWTSVLTVGGAFMGFFTKRLIKDLDNKVNKDLFDEHAKNVEGKLKTIGDDVHEIRTAITRYQPRPRTRK